MKKSKSLLVLGIIFIVVSGLAIAAQNEKATGGKKMTMSDMQKCTTKCMMNCEKSIKDTAEAVKLLDRAVEEIDKGNTAEAKIQIEKAKKMLNEIQTAQKKCMEKMPTVNNRCPISGKDVDMMNCPENRTRMYKDKKIGFCCPNCPAAWDKMTDKEKDESLKKVMP